MLSDSSLEGVPEAISGEPSHLIDDVIAVLIERDPARFLNAHHVTMVGTEQSLITFELDWAAFGRAFDLEVLATMRARGLELPRRLNPGHVSHS
jgi:hypothetical protein